MVHNELDGIFDLFENYVYKYNKFYASDTRLLNDKYKVFKANLNSYTGTNKMDANGSLVYGMNKFSDMRPDEFRKNYLSDLIRPIIYTKNNQHTPLENISKLNLPQFVDWRNKSIVSAVKNQGHCGACWAFSSTETVESMYAKQTGKPVPDLSVQEVIDCAAGNYGCAGGDTCSALNWMVQEKKKLVYNMNYPLVDETQKCHNLSSKLAGVSVADFTCHRYVGNEDSMLKLLSEVGPLVVTIDATTWKSYMGGIIKFHCQNFNNHAVQIVGYDLRGDVPFYIIRNSWGVDFGENGYIYVKIGENLCGIAERVSTVRVNVT